MKCVAMYIAPYRDDLNQIVILNPKGGCGKTTLATNLASNFALHGPSPTLIDNDPNGYSTRWLEKRPDCCRRIHGIGNRQELRTGGFGWSSRIPRDSATVIIDTPAALGRQDMARLTRNADCILIPILPSAFDIHFATRFVAELLLLTQFEKPVGVVANRTRQNTHSLRMLLRMLETLEIPTISVLRNSQNYVQAADLGLGIYELSGQRARRDIVQMDLIVDWLDSLLNRRWEPEPDSPWAIKSPPIPRAATA